VASADASLLRKRLVVWLMALQPCHARQVAALLGDLGRQRLALGRPLQPGRAPKPWGPRAAGVAVAANFDSRAKKASALAALEPRALAGDLLTAGPLRQALEQAAGHRLPTSTTSENDSDEIPVRQCNCLQPHAE
jgi:hypothetical protein